LHVRGYDVDSVVLFDDPEWGNFEFLDTYFRKHGISTFSLPPPPPKDESPETDKNQLQSYYNTTAKSQHISRMLDLLQDKHFSRVSSVTSMPSLANEIVWHPFRQHGIPHNIIAIDSAYNDHFETYNAETDPAMQEPAPDSPTGLKPLTSPTPSSQPLTTSLFDASASWWTQGLGHGNPDIALTAAHAAGRYGHVMFAHAVHQPALDISYNLLRTLQNPRLSRVFFSDNGSTAMEVAVKMALRASCVRYGWTKDQETRPVGIIGLKGSYHGDTIGVMNCSEPSVFNDKVDWHQPWGYWFDPPSLLYSKGKWELEIPEGSMRDPEPRSQQFNSLDEIFDFNARRADAERYRREISMTLNEVTSDTDRRLGALIIEPLLMGAGGMIFVDPLYQRVLIEVVRQETETLSLGKHSDTVSSDEDPTDWRGVPVIADEVFTGLYRLGRASSSSFLTCPSDFHQSSSNANVSSPMPSERQPVLPTQYAPDISVHAKLLTAGLLPLALTCASSSIFNAFLSSEKTDALLHGHSYTAHPIGCMVANKALEEYSKMDGAHSAAETAGWSVFKEAWSKPANTSVTEGKTSQPSIYSFFPPELLEKLSHHPRLRGCFALGTVLVLKMASAGGAGGYTSTASTALQSRLLTLLDDDGQGIHSRVLGDVIYFMSSLTTTPQQIERIGTTLLKALDMDM
jgi:bifunctional dethiobiotin synthetase / adenosylmethionine---8-amino-7-oxononanoate aminotransferase